MGLFSKLAKNIVKGTAKGAYEIYKQASDAVSDKVEEARIEELEERNEMFEKSIAHYSPEDQRKIREIAKAKSMIGLAEDMANTKNDLAAVKFKKLIDF